MLITQSTRAPAPGSLVRELGEDGYYRVFSGYRPAGMPAIDLSAIGRWLARHLGPLDATIPRRLTPVGK